MEEFNASTIFSLLSINLVIWAKERYYRQPKAVQDHVAAERREPVPGYMSHGCSWVRAGDAAVTWHVTSAHGYGQALISAYSLAVLGFGVFLNLKPTYCTAVQLLTPTWGGPGWKGQTHPSQGRVLLLLPKCVKLGWGNIGEDSYTETLDVKENQYNSPRWPKQPTECDPIDFAMRTQHYTSWKDKRNTRGMFTKDKHCTSALG